MSIRTGCIRVGGERVVEGAVGVVVRIAGSTGQVLVHQSCARRVVAVHQHHCCRINEKNSVSIMKSLPLKGADGFARRAG